LNVSSYRTAHAKLAVLRGPARAHRCDCGRRAIHWSYTRNCPEEQFSASGPYCPHPSCYFPQCGRCHKAYDLAGRRLDVALRRKPGQLLLF
jgi:hypothetical protein